MLSEGLRPEDHAAACLAGSALNRIRSGDRAGAKAVLEELKAGYGTTGLLIALLVWSDILNDAVGARGDSDRSFGIVVFGVDEPDELIGVDTAPPWVRWAARFITARAAGDQAQCSALVGALKGPDQTTECFNGLLHVVAQTLNRRERDAFKPPTA